MPTPTDPGATAPGDRAGGATAAAADHATRGAAPIIEFRDVEKRFGDNVVLKDLNFHVNKGERVTLIGPSGSGKTTILRLVMTLEEATDGMILIDGHPLTHRIDGGKRVRLSNKEIKKTRTRIGMVFQQFNLFPNMTVLENITESPIHVLGQSKDEARAKAKDLLHKVGLDDKADAHPSSLSGGQQQRVAIARALAMDPEILLLDEVTSALDPEIVDEVLGILRNIADTTDITMLIVTHEMQFARDVSDRVLMFDGGAIVEDAEPNTMFTAPTHDRTKKFLRAVLGEGQIGTR
ncbi:amino acid ABC transporter ATP-binding protein [Citricoccus sp. K5]|uniref:amino acid ABC transporter ATP-binding protein n=1 Tax=Citricoccus sp. K5 TaxID=2653135 RepID=UPI0012F0E515|nr:putative amino-acid ABC transporter ATP-binding protein y4tH [Citricoccus sp. K5]